MATYNVTGATLTSGVPTHEQSPLAGVGKVYVLKQTVDLTGDAIVDDDIYRCLCIPEDTMVLQVKVKIVTAAVGTSLAMDVGDGDGANSWDDAIDAKATADTWTTSIVGTDAYAVCANLGKFYETADTIDVVMEAASSITAGPSFTIYALCVDYN